MNDLEVQVVYFLNNKEFELYLIKKDLILPLI